MKNKFSRRIVILMIVCAFLAFSIIPILASCTSNRKHTLKIGSWADYIHPQMIDDFKVYYKNITGEDIKVEYDGNFTTTEEMMNKVIGGTDYDLICPSDYIVDEMIENHLVKKIDKNLGKDIHGAKIDNYFSNIESKLLSKRLFDKNLEFSTPYMWGTMGISYNTHHVPEADRVDANNNGTPDIFESWSVLWRTDGPYKKRMQMKDSVRDTYLVASIYMNKDAILATDASSRYDKIFSSVNNSTEENLKKVRDILIKQKQNGGGYESDQGKEILAQKESSLIAIAQWGGDAFYTIEQAQEKGVSGVGYYIPDEGSNLFFDAWVMPKYAKNEKAATLFMNFICRPDNAIKNMEEIGYTSCVATKEVMDWANEKYKDYKPVDLSYFFGNIEGAKTVKMNTAQYPTAKEIDRCVPMEKFGKNTPNVLKYWSEVLAS